jgi:hypothetical protein
MGKQKKEFRIFTHNLLSVKASLPVLKKNGPLKKVFNFFGKIIFFICFKVGLGLIKAAKTAANKWLEEIKNTKKHFGKRIALLKKAPFYSSLALFMAVCIIVIGGFQAFKIIAKGFELKSKVLGISIFGTEHLEEAKNALTEKNYERAQNEFLLAFQSFRESQDQINSAGNLLNSLASFVPQKKQADSILKAAAEISQAGQESVEFYKILGKLKLSPQGLTSEIYTPKEILETASTMLGSIQEKITRANDQVKEMDFGGLFSGPEEQLLDLKQKLAIAKQGIDAFKDVFDVTKALALGKKNVLLLFENNNELRATGGFIGTYGSMTINDGKIENIKISSIYDLDGQLKERILPPLPMFNVNNRWFLRDSNWFVSFPESVKKISSFYEKEGGETPDLVIALTPNLITDLLKLTGPIDLPSHDLTVDAENFVEFMEVKSSIADPDFQNKPKQVLADFFPTLLQKLSELDSEHTGTFFEILQQNLNSKHVIIYSRDQELQQALSNFHWTGEVLETTRDYLSVVNSNLGGTKTDLYIKQTIDLKTSVNPDGLITNELNITRSNTLPKLDKLSNISFIRVLVPKGSSLLSNVGFDYKSFEPPDPTGYKIDSAVYEWERNSVKDLTTGTIIGEEAGKAFFGNWQELEGGQTKTITLVYTLPFQLKDIDHYGILLQKQMGSLDSEVNFRIEYPSYKLEWKKADDAVLENGSLTQRLILNKDYFLGYVFTR